MQFIFTKQAKDGRQIEVFGGEYMDGQFIIRRVTLGGKPIAGPSSRPELLPAPQGGLTHYIGGKPPIGLTTAEAEHISAALQAMRDAWKQTEAAQPILERERIARLRRERQDLIAQYRGLCDEQTYQFERAHDRQDATAYAIRERYDAQIAAAAAAVTAFDAAHPDVLAAIEAENAESLERNRWM